MREALFGACETESATVIARLRGSSRCHCQEHQMLARVDQRLPRRPLVQVQRPATTATNPWDGPTPSSVWTQAGTTRSFVRVATPIPEPPVKSRSAPGLRRRSSPSSSAPTTTGGRWEIAIEGNDLLIRKRVFNITQTASATACTTFRPTSGSTFASGSMAPQSRPRSSTRPARSRDRVRHHRPIRRDDVGLCVGNRRRHRPASSSPACAKSSPPFRGHLLVAGRIPLRHATTGRPQPSSPKAFSPPATTFRPPRSTPRPTVGATRTIWRTTANWTRRRARSPGQTGGHYHRSSPPCWFAGARGRSKTRSPSTDRRAANRQLGLGRPCVGASMGLRRWRLGQRRRSHYLHRPRPEWVALCRLHQPSTPSATLRGTGQIVTRSNTYRARGPNAALSWSAPGGSDVIAFHAPQSIMRAVRGRPSRLDRHADRIHRVRRGGPQPTSASRLLEIPSGGCCIFVTGDNRTVYVSLRREHRRVPDRRTWVLPHHAPRWSRPAPSSGAARSSLAPSRWPLRL